MPRALRSRRRASAILAPYRVIRARPQLFLSFAFGGVVGFLLPQAMQPVARALVAWNAVALCYFALVYLLIARKLGAFDAL